MDWTIKVGDFGLVKSTRSTDEECESIGGRATLSPLAQDFVMTEGVGTELYMSPEQLENKAEYNPRYYHKVDIYALAIILVELLVQFQTNQERIGVIKELKSSKFHERIKDDNGMQKVKANFHFIKIIINYIQPFFNIRSSNC